MSPHYLIAIFALLFPLLTTAVDNNSDNTLIGAWKPLKSISDPHVTEIANYAVDAYTRQNQKHLIFQKVIKGYYQIESGILYKLVIRVKDENVHFPNAEYQAVVLSKGSVSKKLISFIEITN
ncbi:hypothetical protein ACLB2K_059096 [Fragaria x ananassa]